MSTQPGFVEYVAEQAGLGDRLTAKRMFGEYGLYIDGKVVAFACDDSLFVKPADATAALCADLPRRPPYPGAKLYPVADELLDDSERLQALLLATFAAVGDGKGAGAKKAGAGKKSAATEKAAPQKKRTAAKKSTGARKPAAAKKKDAAKKPRATPAS